MTRGSYQPCLSNNKKCLICMQHDAPRRPWECACTHTRAMDPFTSFLTIFFEALVDRPLRDVPLPPPDLSDLRSTLVSHLIADFNCRLLLKTATIDLYKSPSRFPSVFVEHYSTNETLSWSWRRWVRRKWPHLSQVPVPEVAVNEQLAEELLPILQKCVQIEGTLKRPKWRVAEFLLRPKDVLEQSVKYLLLRGGAFIKDNSNYKVEIAMKKKKTIQTNSDDNNEEDNDARVLLAQCVTRLCKGLNYDVNEDEFISIPETVSIPDDNIIVSFTKRGPADDQVLLELNAKDYYSQYSETVVILYNYARIKTILERYDGLVANGEYPELPSIDDVEFGLIGEAKEELPIIFQLYLWPVVRQYVVNIHRRGKGFDKVNLPFLFEFTKSLARAFDSFYNRNVVIVPRTAPHNFRAMFARLYLIQAVGLVFKEFIHLSGIEMD